MTPEQLDLLLQYIDLRVQRVTNLPDDINIGYSDEELNLRQDLRWTLKTIQNL
jgi:hypothetical protein